MLDFSANITETDLRLAIIECGGVAYERRLMASNDGNISVRMSAGNILITPSEVSKGRLRAEDLLIIDLEGHIISAQPNRTPPAEMNMHLEIYKQRADVFAVIHAHPIFATTLVIADLEFPVDIFPETMLALGEVPITAYAVPESRESAESIRPYIKDHNAMLLTQHGSLTYGGNLSEALMHLERIEHDAEIYYRAKLLGTVKHILPQVQLRLIALREKMFKGY